MKFEHLIGTAGDGLWTDKQKNVQLTKITLPYINEEADFGELRVYFDTAGWNIKEDGLIYTDKHFMKALQAQLVVAGYAGLDVAYSEQGMQGEDYVSCDVGLKFIDSFEQKNNTLDGVRASKVSKEDALAYCHKYSEIFIDIDGKDQFDGLVVIVESGTIDPANMGDYGMNDQELGL